MLKYRKKVVKKACNLQKYKKYLKSALQICIYNVIYIKSGDRYKTYEYI